MICLSLLAQWQQLKLQLDGLRKEWTDLDPTKEGLTPHTFKRFVKALKFEAPPITMNNIMTDGRGSFGEFVAFCVADMTDEALNGLQFDEIT
jgi:hypothetical protein